MRNLPATLLRRSALPAVLAFLTLGLSASPASGDVTCTRVAAPGGSDSADGTVDAPFATVQHLVDSLGPGDTGCIRAGTYHEQNITIRNGGAGDTQILNNVIYDNADRGVQLYPDAQRTTIRGNVIDGNGEGVIFSGGDTFASNDNVVEHNIITNAKLRYNVESWYPGSAVGSGNVVRDNCIYGGNEGNVLPSQEGFHATNNVVADPHYADRAAGDFKVQNDTCAKVLAGGSPPASPSGSG